jgi:Nuclear transport factor 2 (NTF2) domain
MVVPLDRAHLIAAVQRSPQAAAAHDRAGWVGLFSADGRIEDSVGSRPHLGTERIGSFYDTFIGSRDIKSSARWYSVTLSSKWQWVRR